MDCNNREEAKARIDGFEIPVQYIFMKIKKSNGLDGIHYHDYIELLYGIDCDTDIWYNGKNYNMKSGDLVVINSKKPHTVISNQDVSTYAVIKFMPQILYAAEQSIFEFKYIIPFIADDEKYNKLFLRDDIESSDIPEIMENIAGEWNEKSYGYEIAMRIHVIRIALWLIRKWHVQNGESGFGIVDESNDAIRSIQHSVEYAQKNYSTATSLEAAKICNLSYSYFSRLFKRVMKKSFTEYVNYIRITESQRLLVSTSKSITDIALDIGFSTTSYFIERFKAQVHITPKQFRKNYRIKA